MSDFVLNTHTGENNNVNFRAEILNAIRSFEISQEQLSGLLSVSSEKLEKILNNEDVHLDLSEERLIDYRVSFLSEGFSIVEPLARLRMIIDSVLIDRYSFSHESLAKYSNVPFEVFEHFYNGGDVEKKYLVNICVHLQMLVFVLTNNPNNND